MLSTIGNPTLDKNAMKFATYLSLFQQQKRQRFFHFPRDLFLILDHLFTGSRIVNFALA
jgi:hypothetical protein